MVWFPSTALLETSFATGDALAASCFGTSPSTSVDAESSELSSPALVRFGTGADEGEGALAYK